MHLKGECIEIHLIIKDVRLFLELTRRALMMSCTACAKHTQRKVFLEILTGLYAEEYFE